MVGGDQIGSWYLVATERWNGGEVRWRSATTGRDLREMRHGARIREALDYTAGGVCGIGTNTIDSVTLSRFLVNVRTSLPPGMLAS